MIIKSLKTEKILPFEKTIFKVLDQSLQTLEENSVLAITSKIIAICEGRVVKKGTAKKDDLVYQEAEYLLPRELNKYDTILTIKEGILIPMSGIDESNAGDYYVLWPEDAQKSANEIRKYLVKRFNLKNVGMIITDSKTTPLRRGTSGVALAHSGFLALNNYIGKPDIFGRSLVMTKANVMDSLAVAAVLVMGEGEEQTPLTVIEDVPFVKFVQNNPSKDELSELKISLEEDLYAPMLQGAPWVKGKAFKK